MKNRIRLILIAFTLFNILCGNLFAQDKWDSVKIARYKSDLVALLKSCDNNFSDIKGAPIQNGNSALNEYRSKKQFGDFSTTILQLTAATYIMVAKLDSSDEDDMEELKGVIASIPGFKVIDSDDSDEDLLEHTDRKITATNSDRSKSVSAVYYTGKYDWIQVMISKKGN